MSGPTDSEAKRHVLLIIDYALSEASVERALGESVRLKGNVLKAGKSYDLGDYEKIYILGSGKASYRMASSLQKILGKRISSGLVIYTEKKKLGRIRVEKGSHPLPSRQSLDATKKLLKLAEKTTEKDLTIYLLSGGTSSLLCYPTTSLKSFVKLNKELIKSKRNIKQVNRIRAKFSRVKGGKLLKHIGGKVLNLVISDVVGDSLEFIGSGPLYTSNKTQNKIDNFIIANNRFLLEKAAEKARRLGYRTKIVYPDYEKSPSQLAKKFLELSKNLKPGSCIISGGELNAEVRGRGNGGPNQEFVLRCRGIKATVASIDSDGLDGNSKAAGAIADEKDFRGCPARTIRKHLKNSDSYSLLRKKGCSIITGPTGNNLNDLRVMVKPKNL